MKACSVDGCGKPRQTRGWCHMHYSRYRRHGDPFAVRVAHWTGDECTYKAAHLRLARQRGKAGGSKCVDCGTAAEQWSYSYRCPKERIEWRVDNRDGSARPMAYSPDPDAYEPRCRSCHIVYDLNREPKELAQLEFALAQ